MFEVLKKWEELESRGYDIQKYTGKSGVYDFTLDLEGQYKKVEINFPVSAEGTGGFDGLVQFLVSALGTNGYDAGEPKIYGNKENATIAMSCPGIYVGKIEVRENKVSVKIAPGNSARIGSSAGPCIKKHLEQLAPLLEQTVELYGNVKHAE